MSNEKATTEKEKEHIAVDFIDPFFATVIAIGLEAIMSHKAAFSTNMLSGWNPVFVLLPAHGLQIEGLALGYLTIILSWVYYHRSIKADPIKIEERLGFARFISDIALLILYWLLLVKFGDVLFQLEVVFLIFLVFVIWDQFKLDERNLRQNAEKRERAGVSTYWLVLSFLLFITYTYQVGNSFVNRGLYDGFFLSLGIVSTIWYRMNKDHRRPHTLFSFLGSPKHVMKDVPLTQLAEEAKRKSEEKRSRKTKTP